MSGPYRFTQEEARSPLDRRPQNSFPAASQPVSFKTNVNRMKTKKWVEAKKNAYDGDDWGDYDEYDEYGAEPPPPQPAGPPAARGYGQRFDEPPARSFTDPQRPQPQHGRRNSFEAGDEHRAFSSSMGPPPQGYPQHQQPPQHPQQPPAPAPAQVHPALRQASGAESDVSDTPQHRRDFSPTALPQPLQTRLPPAAGSATSSPQTQFPPRKSSIGQTESPVAASPRERAPSSSGKPLPFPRPADIYRRVEEERQRERASMDSSRPSLDSLTREQAHESVDAGKSLQPLDTVAERKSEYLSDPSFQPSLPQVEGVSDFGSDFWSASSTQARADPPPPSSGADPGFRTVVDQAFTRSDDQRSVPPTPITNDSGVSRSNTDSTSGISPIMSRVPSSALKGRNIAGLDSSTPVIAEEASETTTPVSGPISAMLGGTQHIARKPSPTHSRNVSGTTVPKSGLATPSPGESPARSPAIAPQAHVAEPESAQLSSLSPSSPDAMEGGLSGPSPVYAQREADIASAIKVPGSATEQLRAAESDSQAAFLESHNAQSAAQNALPRSRSESPSKGRVQELAGRFGEVAGSRRGSTQSNASRHSVDSWERSQDNSHAPSPTKVGGSFKGLAERPNPEREASFRPKLPGQWESYATSAATPQEQEKELGTDKTNNVTSPLGEVDLTPTTAKHSVLSTDPAKSAPDPLSALKAAGTAVGDAIMASVGAGASSDDTQKKGYTHGDALPRPLQLSRDPSAVSSIPPTPPAKDSPASEEPPLPPLKDKSMIASSSAAERDPERPPMIPQMSTDTVPEDQESDRLRKEIVASLSPQRLSVAALDPSQSSLQPNEPPKGRESSIFPSEYDSYWADGDRASPRPSQDVGRGVSSAVEPGLGTAKSSTSPSKPSILNRFSWEEQQVKPSTPSEQTQTPVATAQESAKDEAKIPSPAVENAAKEGRDTSYGAFPDPYFGPAHTAASTAPEPASPTLVNEHAPTPPPYSAKPVASPKREEVDERAKSPVPGLHVVNSALNPEAVDMPPRLSHEVSPVSPPVGPNQEVSSAVQEKPSPEEVSETGPSSPVHNAPAVTLPVSDKPLGSKDIATIKSTSERIANYNGTREYWAHQDYGLKDWVSSMVSANPDLASQSYTPPQPTLAHSATSRHKPSGSISIFGKHHGSSSQQAAQSSASLSQSTPAPTSAPHGGGGRSASAQINLSKGKDFLHSAGVLGGKGMTGAKGLFAKGKSRFKSDKGSQSEASSREGSEEPELILPENLARGSLDSTDTFREEKKKRRFSSPFYRRSSRSRSRPSSIVLPASTHLNFGTPRHTPPRETPPAGSGSRPISFHAPDEWNVIPEAQELAATPSKASLQAPERLGVLPSPAKSQFSLVSHEREEDVPPVPPIPERIDDTVPSELAGGSASHQLLQSVVRNSGAPGKNAEGQGVGGSSMLEPSAKIVEKVVEEEKKDGHQKENIQTLGLGADDVQDTPKGERPLSTDWATLQRSHENEDSDDQPQVLESDLDPSDGRPDSTLATERALEVPHLEQKDSDNDRPPGLGTDSASSDTNTYTTAAAEVLSFLQRPALDEDDDDQPPTLNSDPISSMSRSITTDAQGPPSLQRSGNYEKNDDKRPPVLGSDHELDGSRPAIGVTEFSPKVQQLKYDEVDDDRPPVFKFDSIPSELPPQTTGAATNQPLSTLTNGGDVSPVMSSVGANRLADIERDADGHLAPKHHNSLIPQLSLSIGDVSPMLSPARPAMDRSVQDVHAHRPSNDNTPEPRDARPAYETEIIGGDVSPVSLRNEEGHLTPTKAAFHQDDAATTPRAENVVVKIIEPSDKAGLTRSGIATPSGAAEPTHVVHGQGLASRYHVLHAIQCAPSHSSLESWEQDSIAPSQSDGSQLGDKYDDPDVPPVPPVPSLVQQENHADEQTPRAESSTIPALNSALSIHPIGAARLGPSSQIPPEQMDSEKPQRSESLLSKISSMVSADGASISPVSSHGHRSGFAGSKRPPQASSARNSPNPISTQIMEEPIAHVLNGTNASANDDFDLYADHNGIVKGVQDESGKPLNVINPGTGQSSQAPQFPPSGPPMPQQSSQIEEDDPRRYSDERPMSFVSGPPDVNGRPQDYINPPSPAPGGAIPPTMARPSGKMPGKRGKGANVKPRQQPNLSQVENAEPGPQDEFNEAPRIPNVSPLNSQRGDNRTPTYSNASSPPVSNASPPPQPNAPANLSQRPMLQGQVVPNGYTEHGPADSHPMQDPRQPAEAQIPDADAAQRPPADPRMQNPAYNPDPRMQGPGTGPPVGPRNQHEFQQQMWLRQGMDPRDPRLWNGQQPNAMPAVPPSAPQPPKKEEKSSRPKFLAGLKAFGKSHGSSSQANSQQSQPPGMPQALPPPVQHAFPPQAKQAAPQHLQPPGPRQAFQPPMQPAFPPQANSFQQQPTPPPANNSAHGMPTQSDVRDLPEQVVQRPERSTPMQERPMSMGAVSHFSQDSTRVQAADSRLDLRYPESPAPFKGIPPQLPPPGAPSPPRPQPHRTSTSGTPEPGGKKKRFSSLGNLFNRASASGHSLPTKAKLSKEEKKAQKPSKQFPAPPMQQPMQPGMQPPMQHPMQPQPNQPWPPQQHPGMTPYGSARPFPGMTPPPQQGMQPMPPHVMGPQGRPPYGVPPHGYGPPQQGLQRPPQQGQMPPHVQAQMQAQMQSQMQPQMPPQTSPQQGPHRGQQPPQMPPQMSPPPEAQIQRPPPPSQEGSAYMDSRRITQERQAQQALPTPPQIPPQSGTQAQRSPPPSQENWGYIDPRLIAQERQAHQAMQTPPTMQQQPEAQPKAQVEPPHPASPGSPGYMDPRAVPQERQVQQPVQTPSTMQPQPEARQEVQMDRSHPASPGNPRYMDLRMVAQERQAHQPMQTSPQFQSQHPPPAPTQHQPQYPPQGPYRGQTQSPPQVQPQHPHAFQAQLQHPQQYQTQQLPLYQVQASPPPQQRQQPPEHSYQAQAHAPPQRQSQHLPHDQPQYQQQQQQQQQQPQYQAPQQAQQHPPHQPQRQPQAQVQSSQPQPFVPRPDSQSPQSAVQQNVQPPENAASAHRGAFSDAEQQPRRQPHPPTFTMGIAQNRQHSQDHADEWRQQQFHMHQHGASQLEQATQPSSPQPGAPKHSSEAARTSSSPSPAQTTESISSASQRRVSTPLVEPQYETPEIPAAYAPVSGAYVSPSTEESAPFPQQSRPPSAQFARQYSDPHMQPLSPQVSAVSQMPPNPRSYSNSSAVSAVSPVTGPPSGPPSTAPVSNQKVPRQRMSSITEQSNQERMWNLNLPHGATEQEIVRARQRQYMEQQLATQEQIHAERTGRSPSPRSPLHAQSHNLQQPQPLPQHHQPQAQSGGGFREVLPRSSPRPYSLAQSLQQNSPQEARNEAQFSQTPPPFQGAPEQRGQNAQIKGHAPRLSPDMTGASSPVNPDVKGMAPQPSPKASYTPMRSNFPDTQSPHPSQQAMAEQTLQQQQPDDPSEEQYQAAADQTSQLRESVNSPADTLQRPDSLYDPPSRHHSQNGFPQPEYDEQVPSDEPPPYSGPGVPDEGMEKERHRPPNIVTSNMDERSRPDRQRQVSIGMLQHPQPASMAASPQRSSADMGAESLRRQLLAQEERERQEQLQRAEARRVESERERQERERARARARELERSVSGGGRVGSLRSAAGSTRTTTSGWERRGSTTRPVFELPAEDDEPVMRATSFPGQEWVPSWTDE